MGGCSDLIIEPHSLLIFHLHGQSIMDSIMGEERRHMGYSSTLPRPQLLNPTNLCYLNTSVLFNRLGGK